MATIIGSARIDEKGQLSGGQAGDQTGKEVSTQEFYVHSKGWNIIRAKDKTIALELAKAMLRACENKNIGYDQYNRLDIIRKSTDTSTPSECDCSSLVRRCVIEASGVDPGNFTTANELTMLEKTNLFYPKITYSSKVKLYTGDILVTQSKGHTAIVVSGITREDQTTAGQRVSAQQAEFLSRIVPIVQRQVLLHGNKLYASVTIAQAIHESGWGSSKRMVAANALLGFKVGSGKKYGKAWHGAAFKSGTTEYYDGKTATKITDYFRQYDTVEDSVCDYMDLLCNNKRYSGAVSAGSPRKSIEGIVSGGYATGPNYVQSIINLITQFNLLQYDKETQSLVCPYAECTTTLRRGMKGTKVKYLQWMLKYKFKMVLEVDGSFGPTTENKVKEFQRSRGFKDDDVDGVVGSMTWKEIKNGT